MTNLQKIGKYDLLGLIAQGGMGNVYLARAEGLAGFSKLVVVKTLRADLADDVRFREMFLDEARLAARLNHRNVVQTNDVGESNGVYFMVMDYLEGRSLAKIHRYVQKHGARLPLALEVRMVTDMLAGLHYAHELQDFDGKPLGVVHRDVCPANVFVTIDGQVKVVDFGVAKAKNHAHETQAGTIKGRVAYMSPEHVTGKPVDRRADVFSAGIMLWEAIEGRRFWDGSGEAQILGQLLRGALPEMTARDVPPMLRDACARALSPEPDGRFPTAHAMRVVLEEWLEKAEDRKALPALGANIKEWFANERARVAQAVESAVTPARRAQALPELESAAVLPGSSTMSSAPRQAPPSMSAGTMSATAPFVASGDVAPPASPSRVPWALAALAGVVLVVGLGVAVSRKQESNTTGAEPPPSANLAEEGKTRLTVKVSPVGAKIFVDEQEAFGNPHMAFFPKGSGKHLVRAVAPGFAAKSELVDLSDNLQVNLTLEPLSVALGSTPAPKIVFVQGKTGVPAPVHGPAPTPATPAAPIVPAPAAPASVAAPLHTVDPSNPYVRPATGRGVDPNNPYGQ
jgi:eukaryotic-like serine/threonine-protein kinase